MAGTCLGPCPLPCPVKSPGNRTSHYAWHDSRCQCPEPPVPFSFVPHGVPRIHLDYTHSILSPRARSQEKLQTGSFPIQEWRVSLECLVSIILLYIFAIQNSYHGGLLVYMMHLIRFLVPLTSPFTKALFHFIHLLLFFPCNDVLFLSSTYLPPLHLILTAAPYSYFHTFLFSFAPNV